MGYCSCSKNPRYRTSKKITLRDQTASASLRNGSTSSPSLEPSRAKSRDYAWAVILSCVLFPTFSWADDLRDIKPPINEPTDYTLLIILITVGVLVAGFFFGRWYKRQMENEQEDPRTLKEKALDALRALQQQPPPESEKLDGFYSVLSGIVRKFIEDHFKIQAEEMTTEEFMEFCKGSEKLTKDEKDLLKEFLTECDMVKFAKHKPTAVEMQKSFQLAVDFINGARDGV